MAISGRVASQPIFPPNSPVFDSSVVARVDITINPDTLEWIYDNVESDIEFHATFKFNNGTINETMENIGFRLRGNTSRWSQKKSFKVSFNSFEAGRKFYGLEKMNLNGEHNDPTIARARISWEWLRQAGIPAPRSAHTQVFINGNYYGLYLIVEHVDEEFVKSRFGNNDGNLYKCLYPADLAYINSNPNAYKLTSGSRRVYDLITNEEADDYSDLAHFISTLNNTPASNLECEIEKVFNLNNYLKIMALDVVTGNWDGYIFNKNNFYLYHNTETGRFEYIPYDLDNTFGIDWFDIDWGKRNMYYWAMSSPEVRPLYNRLLQVPSIRARYSYYMDEVLGMLANEDSLFAEIDDIRSLIAPHVLTDPYYPRDYGYSYSDFLNSYTNAAGDHVTYGLKTFIQTRNSYAFEQISLQDIAPAMNYLESGRPEPGKEYWVRIFVEDEDNVPDVKLIYWINSGNEQAAQMYDDGNHHDLEPGDGFYGGIIGPFQLNESLTWQVKATDSENKAAVLPCQPFTVNFHESADPQLFINELMADNDSTIADEYGEYDNWVEIYNGDDEPVWLGDKYLSDNLSNPDKWQLPDVTMQPGSFIIIWADGQPEQGPFHAEYKLNDEGEELGIFDNETTGYFLIDSVSWGVQEIDVSYGRQADGELPWVFFEEPTPGATNELNAIGEEDPQPAISFYPNPVTDGRIKFREPFSGIMTDMMGRIIIDAIMENDLDVTGVSPGVYFLVDRKGAGAKVIIR